MFFTLARDPTRGRDAVRLLEGEGLHPDLLVMDVSSEQSVVAGKQSLEQSHNRLDVLINNAALLIRVRAVATCTCYTCTLRMRLIAGTIKCNFCDRKRILLLNTH